MNDGGWREASVIIISVAGCLGNLELAVWQNGYVILSEHYDHRVRYDVLIPSARVVRFAFVWLVCLIYVLRVIVSVCTYSYSPFDCLSFASG